jgi:hypothetical protein
MTSAVFVVAGRSFFGVLLLELLIARGLGGQVLSGCVNECKEYSGYSLEGLTLVCSKHGVFA